MSPTQGNSQPAAPSPEDFSNRAVMRRVISEATQSPTTLFPAAVAILSGAYMGLVGPSESAFYIAVGGGLLSLLSWVFHYFIRGEKVAAQYINELKDKRQIYKENQTIGIEDECRKVGFIDGQTAAKELNTAYIRLESFLKEKARKDQNASAQRFLILAESSYDQGIVFLSKALSLFKILKQMDQRKLADELKSWQREIEVISYRRQKEGDSADLMIRAIQEKIRSHNRRLELYAEREETLKQALAQCEILEATLDSAYLEVVDLLDTEFRIKQDDVAGNLERAVAAARKVEDHLRGNDKKEEFDDSIYVQPKA